MFIRSILCATVAITLCTSGTHASAASKSLTSSDFAAAIADGATFVKFYSPECPHSQNLAPTWEQLAMDHKDWSRARGFKFAEVDCLAQGDLCEDNDVVSYPTMQLYYKGKPVAKYNKRRTSELLNEYVASMSAEYINVPSNISTKEVGEVKVNPFGKVIVLDKESYDRRTRFGPWLIEYYAPWCGHCKNLAPIYEELAGALKDKVNVAKVDCTQNQAICMSEEVRGYPTIKLRQYGQSIEYMKHRTLQHLSDFALGAIVPSVKSITAKDLNDIKNNNDVAYVFVHDSKVNPDIKALIDRTSQTFYEQIALHGADDTELAHQLSVSSPALVALKDNRQYQYQGSLTDEAAVKAWIKETKNPLVTTLTNENTGTVLSKHGWTVIGLFDPSNPATENARRELIETAYQYYATIADRTTLDGQPLRFVILDAPKWEGYVRGALKLDLASLPAVLVINSREEIYYPYGLDGRRVPVEQSSLLNYISEVESGLLTPKSMLSLPQKGFRYLNGRARELIRFSGEHPMIAMAVGSAFLLAIMRKFPAKSPEAQKEEADGKDIKQD
ncbi:hypothetical protein BX616_004800 [Lobosporangium transversale]|uniref:Thioredoxin-like protein n=1 Tax=Lobosporangium transversale TaxID=64571 RepID=A0A1Y2H1D1_9FUNG|nr:thioredoxin-like protein [Lobosporangium transversale]KAF9916021.1 hypothetical protein BX616_004800 [Lobosporangium transversale]ORZ28357.1 thioredoxin-like protein [Lobosporangium transversale]|eukprot:XP_021886042.1 thioredoxin-like protein [Lobosporangium transversale]